MLFPREEFTGKNGCSYILRSPEISDAEKMIAYLKATASETEYGLSYPEELDFSVKDEEDFISAYSADKGSIMISAFKDGELVANASLSSIMDRKKSRHRATFGMAILKNEWRNGLGEKILSGLIAFAKQAGYEQIELEVASCNYGAVSLYKKLGFAIYGERPCSLKLKSGEYYDELLMLLKLK